MALEAVDDCGGADEIVVVLTVVGVVVSVAGLFAPPVGVTARASWQAWRRPARWSPGMVLSIVRIDFVPG